MKDNFSTGSQEYARYRPTYPGELFEYLYSLVFRKRNAWDCGTGNGQIAGVLASSFDHVYASDISQLQIDNAIRRDNITYSIQPAEKTAYPDGLFDLVVVAQAIHWFDFDKFYTEVKRTAASHGILAVAGYGMLTVTEPIDECISGFYNNTIGPYWDKERRYIDENYKTIPFPFQEIPSPAFVNVLHWKLEHLEGYLNTWSAVKHYIRSEGINPVTGFIHELRSLWKENEIKEVRFPILLRVGEVK